MRRIGIIINIIVIISIYECPEIRGQAIHDPVVEKVAQGIQFTEGPVWKEGVGLLFSDIPQNTVFVWNPGTDATIYLNPTGKSNGLAIDNDGNLIMCQHFDRQVGKYVEGEDIQPLITHYEGKRLNSPNDLTIKSDGSIFFTDPPFGLNDEGGTSELGFSGIYRLSPSGALQLLDQTLNYPNGIVFSPDESKLYVSESDVADVYVWDVIDDTALANKTLFYDIPGQWADGMKTDTEGYLYVTGPVGLWIIAPDGTLVLSKTILPGTNSTNCNWGPEEEPTLYITAGNSVFKITNKKEEPQALNGIRRNALESNILYVPQPNPFSQLTSIAFFLEKESHINLAVLDNSGRKILILADRIFAKGQNNVFWNTLNVPDGVYFILMTVENDISVQRCIRLAG
jgi:sugar lactone lactonase YvrE